MLRRTEPLAPLAALFAQGLEVPRRRLLGVLSASEFAELCRAGVLEQTSGVVRASIQVTEYDGLLLASDHDTPSPAGDHVLGVTQASVRTAALTVRRPAGRALDLATGGGIQALLAARHATAVLGVDANPRALAFARLNTALNGATDLTWSGGDFFEPVAAEHFDLIVANPPAIVGPQREFLFRDGGHRGDDLSRLVTTGTAQRLAEGGFGTVLCDWITNRRDDWRDTPTSWVENTDCDALLLNLGTHDALDYAVGACTARGNETHADAVDRWLRYFRDLGIEAITTGAIVLRRSEGPHWIHADEAQREPAGAAGEQILRIFEAHDLLAGLNDERALLDRVFAVPSGCRVVWGADIGVPVIEGVAQLTLADGVGLNGRFPAPALPAVTGLDGNRTLRELAGDDPEPALDGIRQLLVRGFLEPAPGGRRSGRTTRTGRPPAGSTGCS